MLILDQCDWSALMLTHLSSSQSVHQAPGVCVEVWVAVRGKALGWVTESVCATPATRDSCARAAPMATSERRAPTTAWRPVQVLLITDRHHDRQILILLHHKPAFSSSSSSPCSVLPLLQEVRRTGGLQMPGLQGGMDAPWQQVCRWVRLFTAPLQSLRSACCLADLVCLLDIDECGTELARCPSNTYCHNTDGSYECKGMTEGLSSVDLKAVDVNLLKMWRK